MLMLPRAVRILLAAEPVDMRKSIDGLTAVVRNEWKEDLYAGQLFVFVSKRGECVIFTARCVHASYPNTTKRSTRFAIASRYVQTHVRVYPDWSEFSAHGGRFTLDDYGTVLVSGEDRFGHNRVRAESNRGEPFPYCER